MLRLNFFSVLAFILLIAVVGAETRSKRSPQFGQARAGASASAGGFGAQSRPGFGLPLSGSGFGGRPGLGGNSRFGSNPILGGNPRLGGSGGSINIAKSISISRGPGTPSQASASSFGKK